MPFLRMRPQNFSGTGRYAQVAACAVRQEMVAAYASRRNNQILAVMRRFARGIGPAVISAGAKRCRACGCQQ